MYGLLLLQISRRIQLLKTKKTKKTKNKWKHFTYFFLESNDHLLRRVLRTRPFGIKIGLNIIARNKRDCLLAFVLEVHLENTRFVCLFNTE